MRPICAIVVLWLAANLVRGEDARVSSATAGLHPKEVEEGFVNIFDGETLDGWQGVAGSTDNYYVEDGILICKKEGFEHIFTKKQYTDFILRLEFKFEPGGANNGVGIRTPISRTPHLDGMEIQVLDDSASRHKNIKPYQHHGSIYGCVPAMTGHLKPVGQWNCEEIVCKGRRVRVTLNRVVIVDADLDKIPEPTMDGKPHPGLKNKKGHIGLHAHGRGHRVFFRRARIKEL